MPWWMTVFQALLFPASSGESVSLQSGRPVFIPFLGGRLTRIMLLLGTVATLATVTDATNAAEKRNVVIVVADDLGKQLGCYGDTVTKTPNLDRFAKEAVRFTRAYCTTASCSASRSVLMSGLYNHATGHFGHAHGYNHFSTYESVKSLPVILGEAGYRTCLIGKYHLAPEATYQFQTQRQEGTQGSRNTVRMAKNAKDWIAEQDDRPFFLYFCPTDPHRHGPGDFANHAEQPDHYPGITPHVFRPEEVPVPKWLPDQPEVRKELAEYYQAIARLDVGMGTLFDALKETGHWDDTLILFLSDNGPPFPGAKTTLYEPGANLPLLVRNPEGKNRGTTSDALVTWVDVTPTVLDFCRVTPKPVPPVRPMENGSRAATPKGVVARPYTFHGRSFLSVLDQEKTTGWDETYYSHTFHEVTMYYPMRAIRSGRYKLIFNIANPLPFPFASDLQESPTWQGVLKRNTPSELYGRRPVRDYLQRPRFELYDLATDPDETKNLAGEAAHQEAFTSLQTKLRQWQDKTKDPWELKWGYE